MTGKLFFILFFLTAGILGAQEVKQESAADSSAPKQEAAAVPAAEEKKPESASEQQAQEKKNTETATDNAAQNQIPAEAEAQQTESKPKKEHPAGKSYYEPSRNHNPMMSPRDYEKIRMEEQAKRDAEEAARRAEEEALRASSEPEAAAAAKKAPKIDHLAVISKRLKVTGIVGTMALINGDWYEKGKFIKMGKPYNNAVRLKTVGGNYIVIEYKGKTATKNLSSRY